MSDTLDPRVIRQRLREDFSQAIAAGKPRTARRLLESFWLYDSFGGSDLWDRIRPRTNDGDAGWMMLPPSVPSDRRHGSNWPLWRNQPELDQFRQQSRVLVASNSFAQGMLRSKTNSVIGKGYSYKIALQEHGEQMPEEEMSEEDKVYRRAVQNVVDKFLKLNHWNASIDVTDVSALGGTRERECYRTVQIDGDCFLRFHGQEDGTMLVRPIDASQIRDGQPYLPTLGWTYGIQHQMDPFEDVETPLRYAVYWPDVAAKGGEGWKDNDAGTWEEIDAAEVLHLKGPDTPATVKRGLPLFVFDVAQSLERASKLQRNASIGASIRAAIAETWQYDQATQMQISSMAQALAERQITNNVTGQSTNIERVFPGMIRRGPTGSTLVQPSADNTASYLTGKDGDLQQASAGAGIASYELGGLESGNYSNFESASYPPVVNAQCEQEYFKMAFTRVIWKAIMWAAECGELPTDVGKRCKLVVEAPAVLHRNELEKAQEDQIGVMNGWKDRQTCAAERGLDWHQVQANNEQYMADMGGQMGALPMPGEDGEEKGGQGGSKPFREGRLREVTDDSGHKHDNKGLFTGNGGGSKEKSEVEPAKQRWRDAVAAHQKARNEMMAHLEAGTKKAEEDFAVQEKDLHHFSDNVERTEEEDSEHNKAYEALDKATVDLYSAAAPAERYDLLAEVIAKARDFRAVAETKEARIAAKKVIVAAKAARLSLRSYVDHKKKMAAVRRGEVIEGLSLPDESDNPFILLLE